LAAKLKDFSEKKGLKWLFYKIPHYVFAIGRKYAFGVILNSPGIFGYMAE